MRERPAAEFLRDLREGVFLYLAQRPVSGYSWRDDLEWALPGETKPKGPWLVGPAPLGVEYPARPVRAFRRYREDPGLHRAFARLKGTAEVILTFANRYGTLADSEFVAPPEGGAIYAGESLAYWRDEVKKMATLVAIWDLAQAEDSRELKRYIFWQRNPLTVTYMLAYRDGALQPELVRRSKSEKTGFYVDRAGVIAHEQIAREADLLKRWTYGDVLEPARYFVHREVNQRMNGHVNFQVFPYLEGTAKMAFLPDSLLTALYVMFALELAGKARPKECPNCHEPFLPSRRNQRYCRANCRKNASYDRGRRLKSGQALEGDLLTPAN